MTKSEASLLGLGMKDVKVQGISTVQLLFQGGEYVIELTHLFFAPIF